MSNEDRIVALLTEIRDAQREAVEFARESERLAREMSARSIANQERAIASQLSTAKLYRRVVLVVIPVIVGALGYVIWNLAKHL